MKNTDSTYLRFPAWLLAVAVGTVMSALADDTEIYQTTVAAGDTARPKVLIVFDNSPSMETIIPEKLAAYVPATSYPDAAAYPDRIYWSRDGEVPQLESNNYFVTGSNRCAESVAPLDEVGFYQSRARRWRGDRWARLNDSDQSPVHVECMADVLEGNASNPGGSSSGFPKAGTSDGYGAAAAADSDIDWGDSAYTFYQANYLAWFHNGSSSVVPPSRLEIAQEVVTSLIAANSSIDFGLALFNNNGPAEIGELGPHNGGRIVHRIIEDMLADARNELNVLIDNLDINIQSGTPLCETTYEVYRYLSGSTVQYGDLGQTEHVPGRDINAEDSAGTYVAPITDCAHTYVILMTDGLPTYDDAANAAIEGLTGKTCSVYADDHGTGGESKNCLPEIAEYMANTDLDGDEANGNQHGITYTIGFTTDQPLLQDAARRGKGKYYTADSATQLTAAFQHAVLNILSTNATFTSPAVAVDAFSQTRSDNNVFFAMFRPEEQADWAGNIKKLQISIDSNGAALVDKNGAAAINPGTGQISDNASTFWSDQDGPEVLEGGVGALLAARDPTGRNLWTNTGAAGLLEEFEVQSMDPAAFGHAAGDQAAVNDEFGVGSDEELEQVILWARGVDVDDEDNDGDTTDTRPWILADILHSKPLVINYGSPGTPDLRIIVGTNGGFLHMFGNDDGEEDWAFFPKELAALLSTRRDNVSHSYGIDASATMHHDDKNFNGVIDADDKVWIFFGLRRGGRALYALDVTNPDTPSFSWLIDDTSEGFEELGQTWSVPTIARVPGYKDDAGKRLPVLIFGAGYDETKDSHEAVAADATDLMGRGVFMVGAESGALVWSVTQAVNSANNLQETDLVHSVPGGITALDSNGDRLTDRLYFADTGGNVWRVDMPGDTLPDGTQSSWRVVKLAALNTSGAVASGDRRFFNAPDVVRTVINNELVDAVLIGSGDRTNPAGTDVDNRFYMLRDRQVLPYTEPCSNDADDFCTGLPLSDGDLYDTSSDIVSTGTDAEVLAAVAGIAAAGGWYLELEASGEKSLSRALTIDGRVYFTTFSPTLITDTQCLPEPGTARLYVVNMINAAAVRSLDGGNDYVRFVTIGSLIPDTPAPHFGSDGQIRLLLPPGSGGYGTVGNPMETGSRLASPYGHYWYREQR